MMCVLWGDDAGRGVAVRRGGDVVRGGVEGCIRFSKHKRAKELSTRQKSAATTAHTPHGGTQLDHSQHLSALAPCRIPTRTPRTRTLKTHLKTLPSLLSRSTLANNGRITPQTHAAHRSKNSYNPREVHHENTNRLTRTLTCSPHRIHIHTRSFLAANGGRSGLDMQRCVLLCRWYRAALPAALLKEGACQHRREEHTAGCAVGGDVALKKDDTCVWSVEGDGR